MDRIKREAHQIDEKSIKTVLRQACLNYEEKITALTGSEYILNLQAQNFKHLNKFTFI